MYCINVGNHPITAEPANNIIVTNNLLDDALFDCVLLELVSTGSFETFLMWNNMWIYKNDMMKTNIINGDTINILTYKISVRINPD